jgi:hypothetical protein
MEGTFFLAFWTEIQIKSYSGGQKLLIFGRCNQLLAKKKYAF